MFIIGYMALANLENSGTRDEVAVGPLSRTWTTGRNTSRLGTASRYELRGLPAAESWPRDHHR